MEYAKDINSRQYKELTDNLIANEEMEQKIKEIIKEYKLDDVKILKDDVL